MENKDFANPLYSSGNNWNIFLALAYFGSFTSTAAHFRVSQSVISKAIQKMEKDLGVKLINREKRPITLTQKGLLLKEELEEEGSRFSKVLKKVREPASVIYSLRIGCVESVCRFVIPALAEALSSELNKFSQISGNSQILLEKLLNREIDTAIVASSFPEQKDIYRKEIFEEPSILLFPSFIPQKESWTWSDLKNLDLPLIFSSEQSAAGKLNQRFLSRINVDFPNHCEIDSDAAMMGLIESGFGWAITRPSTLFASAGKMKKVRAARLPAPAFNRKLYLICRKGSWQEEADKIAPLCENSLMELKVRSLQLLPWLSA